MPGYDGTGPKGLGPMTGGGRGFCLLKFPGAPNESLTGFVGQSGHPVRLRFHGIGADLESLQARIWNVETAIRCIQRRVGALEATHTETRNSGS